MQQDDDAIAVTGLACRYPGAADPGQFWENILARRRQFRRMPDQRLPLADYYDPNPKATDKTYATKAAVIDGFDFDWVRWRIPKTSFEATDIVHWLALDVAQKAFADAGYSKGKIPTQASGVILGNTLTGEQTRSQSLRLRWPFVRRVLLASARAKGVSERQAEALAETMQEYYKSVFAPITEDSLAGGLSNTIAGRICNYFDLHGGGYSVDGACSSSLIAVATAASSLARGDLDLALAGGVDVSLDTFELIGFAKTGALSATDMRVYDRRANGFIPGEGCGFVVLKRLRDATADGDYVYATLSGWGISSDGKGGITAPSGKGQSMALKRARNRDGSSMLDFVEGHGTGTPVGDREELKGVAMALGELDGAPLRRCGITSVKSIIGHTKAAAGVAGFIKAVMAVNQRVLPPTAGCTDPNPVFSKEAKLIYPILRGEVRSPSSVLRAGVSAMGFGGINSHITLESADPPSDRLKPTSSEPFDERALLATNQESELFVLASASVDELGQQIRDLDRVAALMSDAEMVDLAAQLADSVSSEGPWRAAIVARSPEALGASLNALERMLKERPLPPAGATRGNRQEGIWLGNVAQTPRLGFLFPGQGSQRLNMARRLVERYSWARELLSQASEWLRAGGYCTEFADLIYKPTERALDEPQLRVWKSALSRTEIAQPALCLCSLLWLGYLERLGLRPRVVGGHSLGELTAFHAAGAFDARTLLELAALRGEAMSTSNDEAGTMASLACSRQEAQALLQQVSGYLVIANSNSPAQTVVSGEKNAVANALEVAKARNILVHELSVSNAFHSRLVAGAAQRLRTEASLPSLLEPLSVRLFSSVDGREIQQGVELKEHFARQMLAPVDFVTLVENLDEACDLLVEVGSGRVLSGLVESILDDPEKCFAVESKAEADTDLNLLLANYFVRGGEVDWEVLYSSRLVRPFLPAWEMRFIDNQCERPLQLSATPLKGAGASRGSDDFALPSGPAGSTLAAMIGVSVEACERYLARRGPFLAAIVKADMACLPITESPSPSIPAPVASVATDPPGPEAEQPKPATINASERFMQLVAARSGFPRSTLSPELRLLDDLNLDSIKAASLIAEAATQMNLAEQLDPADHVNATLEAIGKVLDELTGANTVDEPSMLPSISDLLLDLVAQRSGFPRETLNLEQHLLDDLNLDSIKAAELVAQAAAELGVSGEFDPGLYANASLQTIADQLVTLSPSRQRERPQAIEAPPATTPPRTVMRATWVRDFAFEPVEEAFPPASSLEDSPNAIGKALILCEESEHDLAEALAERLRSMGGTASQAPLSYKAASGFTTVVALLPRLPLSPHPFRERLSLLVAQLRAPLGCLAGSEDSAHPAWVVFVEFGGGFFGRGSALADLEQCCASGYAASLHLERPELKVRVLDFATSVSPEDLRERVWAELQTPERYAAVGFDEALTRRVPRPRMLEPANYASRCCAWSSDDVVLVTGGAKGITAECVFALARETGVRLALVGSSPAGHAASRNGEGEVAKTLQRFHAAGLTAHYYPCDVTDTEAVGHLIAKVREELGKITAVIHGAGLNKPAFLEKVSAEEAIHEVSPKVLGAVNLCNAVEQEGIELKMFLGLASIIGVTGMQRNGWYAFSNQALSHILAAFHEKHPACAVLSLAYSIWDEVGMGARLGSTTYLAKLGIDAIPVSEGVARFLRLLMHDPGVHEVVTTARLGGLDTWTPAESPIESRSCRFLEQIVSYVPGVETIARARLSLERDAYLKDHVWRDSHLFPTVFGLEAMAQTVAHVTGETDFDTLRIEHVDLERPIVVDAQNGATIEIRAEVLERVDAHQGRRVKAEIGVEQTGFSRAHFSAVFVLEVTPLAPAVNIDLPAEPLDLEPKQDLYGWLLFQGGAFQRIRKVYTLDSSKTLITSTLNDPDIATSDAEQRFLGDAYFRDSMLQSVQLPLTQEICLPVAIESIERYAVAQGQSAFILTTVEEKSDRDVVATIVALNDEGGVLERIRGRMRILEYRHQHPTPEVLAMRGKTGLQAGRQQETLPNPDKSVSKRGEIVEPDLTYSHNAAIERAADGRLVLVVRAAVTFREAANLSRTLYFPHLFSWIGKLRETVVEPVSREMVALFSTGEWGMVTNSAEIIVGGNATSGDVIEGRAWVESLSGTENSKVEMCFEWHKLLPDRGTEVIATGRMSSTWVAILEPGVVEVRPFPEFLRRFVERFLPPTTRQADPASRTVKLRLADLGQELYRMPQGPVTPASLLQELTFDTSREDANLVGNLYFANYSVWQGRTVDRYFHELKSKIGELRGELRCSNCRIDHLQEAMPFEQILVRMYLRAVNELGIRLYFDYFRLTPDGQRHKIAFAEQQAVWFEPAAEGRWEPGALPAVLRTYLVPKSRNISRRAKAKAEHHDVVVVGAGIGGLTAAALLAMRGRKVVVLEQHNKPGGCCASWSRSLPNRQGDGGKPLKFIFDTGVQDISGVTPGGHVHKLLQELGITERIEWQRVSHEYIQSGLRLKVPWSMPGFKTELATRFPRESEGLSALFAEIEACNQVIYRHSLPEGNVVSQTGSPLTRWANKPFITMLRTYLRDERLIHLLGVLSHYISDDPSTLDALTICPLFAYYTQGGYYPMGGPQALTDALVSVIEQNGGELRLRTPVSRILVEQGGARGVRLGDGSVLNADEVIANTDVRRTYLELVGREHLQRHFRQRIESLRASCSAFLVMLGLDIVPEAEPLTLILDDEGKMTQVGTLSKIDPSLAPPGHSRVLLFSLIPHAEARLWERGATGYEARKQRYGDTLIRIAEQAIPGLSKHIVFREDATPATYARYLRATDGAIYGLDMQAWRPSIKTPIRNLSLVGAGVAPRPGVEEAVRTGIRVANAAQPNRSEQLVSKQSLL